VAASTDRAAPRPSSRRITVEPSIDRSTAPLLTMSEMVAGRA
jgi:hypothetical protein